MNTLYYGDNLSIMRDHIPDASVDLVYLDPPFNSKQPYNVIFQKSEAQITAFVDTWHWTEQAQHEYDEIMRSPNTDAAEMIRAMRRFLAESDMMAYLVMMTSRLLELHRILKPTGSLYLHCDPTASHYLKVVMDSIFGPQNFRNEIIWQRTSAHSSAKRFGPNFDTIFFYSKSDDYTWNPAKAAHNPEYVKRFYKHEDERGRFRLSDLTAAGVRRGSSGAPWKGVNPTAVGRHWAVPTEAIKEVLKGEDYERLSTQEKLDILDKAGRIVWPAGGGVPSYKRYWDEVKEGQHVQAIWTDISPVGAQAAERLGYPTQKPLALLERIIKASSNEGDVVLDPFCGCGTAVHAAQKLGRQWIGIDITHLAIALIEKRMRDAFPDIQFRVEGTPKDLASARDLMRRDPYQFQWWACSLVGAQPYRGKRKGADKGIDGLIFFTDIVNGKAQTQKIVVSVKGGDSVGVAMIRELITVVHQNEAEMGFFVTLAEPTQPMMTEAVKEGFYRAGNGQEFPRIQILTIEGLLSKTESPQFIDLKHGLDTFKKAPREKNDDQQLPLM